MPQPSRHDKTVGCKTKSQPYHHVSNAVGNGKPVVYLLEEHYLHRRWTLHNKATLQEHFYSIQEQKEQLRLLQQQRRTVYMDGVFDWFHTGHLQAIQQYADLGQRVVIGVTGDADAAISC